MAASRSGPCSKCGKVLSSSDFDQDRALVLLGHAYCLDCLEARILHCHLCKASMRTADFDAGRAVTLLGLKYCGRCLDQAVGHARTLPPAPAPKVAAAPPSTDTGKIPVVQGDQDGESRRMFSRFVPPVECKLTLKPDGLRGILSSNLLQLWVDVSEGGLRAVVSGGHKAGDLLQGKMTYAPLSLKLDFKGNVRHCKASEKYHGCVMVGLKFENPSSELQSFIREVMGQNTSMMAMKAPSRPRSAPKTEIHAPAGPPPARSA